MSRTSDLLSERLSDVMDDIGVNERLVEKRRRAHMLMEEIWTIQLNRGGLTFNFGSRTEGSTTLGLESDLDGLICDKTVVIQNMSERNPNVDNLLMIQNENISSGYCYLQLIKPDLSLPGSVNDIEVSDLMEQGRLLLKNTWCTSVLLDNPWTKITQHKLHGPALTTPGKGVLAQDVVPSLYCASSPHQVTSWLQKQQGCKWPTEDVLEECRNVGCFMVPVGSKVAYTPELEWRISTCLQEKYLMFSLNITQLRCYILMKMILKTYIEPHVEDVLTSFMCKNVLWYCIANSSQDWHTGNLLSYLHLCLFMLKECVEQRNCPHFIIPENNLLAGHMTHKQRGTILDIINNLLDNDEQFLYEIQMDDLSRRLKMKFNMIPYCSDIAPAFLISHMISTELVKLTVGYLAAFLLAVINEILHESIERALPYLFLVLTDLERNRREGDSYRRTASELLIPLVSSTLGSVIASSNIDTHKVISDQAFTYLEAGKETDALSGRLKLVSVLYCTGDMERAESELRISQILYRMPLLDATLKCNDGSACRCHDKVCDDYNEAAIKSYAPLSPLFLKCEINCVPHELRYEILKSYIEEEDRKMRSPRESLQMDLIVVDPVPYLYFLQYKIYGHLLKRKEQQMALFNLEQSIYFEPRILHKETALNLLGQCMEQEDRQAEAFQYYLSSLKHRKRNKTATFLLCIQLFKLWKQHNAQ